MYVQDERHTDSDPNSRHQQTEQSYLKDHWKQSKKSKAHSQTTDPDDPHAKPSQTENSWLQDHRKPKSAEGPSCSCQPKRSKSADPPPVTGPVCMCHSKGQPCGVRSQRSRQEKPSSVRISITEPSTPGTSFKSALSDCTKDLIDSHASSSKPPYWAGQSNVVPGPSHSRAMFPSTSKGTATSYKSNLTYAPIFEPSASRSGGKPCGSKSLASIPGGSKADQCKRSAMTWLSALKDPESKDSLCPKADPCYSKKPVCPEATSVSCPPSQANYRSVASRPPYHQTSFGVDYETSASTRSRSIVDKITCLCPPDEQSVAPPAGSCGSKMTDVRSVPTCSCDTDEQSVAPPSGSGVSKMASVRSDPTCPCDSDEQSVTPPPGSCVSKITDVRSDPTCACDTDFMDADGTSEANVPSCTSARIQHPSGFSEYAGGSLRGPKRVSLTPPDCKFCDCHSSSGSPNPSCMSCQQQKSDPILTSLHSHRSLSGGSCLCDEDESPRDDLSQSPCVLNDCQCFEELSDKEQGCSCQQLGSGFKTPEDPCGASGMACSTRKQRVLCLVEDLSAPSGCECGESRASKIQQLFRELTLLLRSESECAVAPTEEEPCSLPLPFDECCAAQHEDHGEKDCERPMSKKELQRVECFHQLEEYLRKCFLPPPEPQVPESDIYGFEHDPDYSPEAEKETKFPRTSVQFYDAGDQGDDGEVFQDCEDGGEGEEPAESLGEEEEEPGDKDPCKCEVDDLCDKLRTFIDREVQEIEAIAKGKELEEKTTQSILKELCEGSTIMVPTKREPECPKAEVKGELSVCPYAGMESCQPWTKPRQETPLYPYTLPFDPCVEKEPSEVESVGEPRGLLPPGPLTPDVRTLCEELIRKALKECGLCPAGSNETITHSCEECPEDECCCEPECPEECQEECAPAHCTARCLCCHCRALICDDECKTVSNTLRSAMCDPLCEMKYFIDSMIIDLHAMDCVLGTKKAKPKDIRANDASRMPNESFPVKISNVTSLGCSSLFIQWEVADCRAIAGYEIYVDGHLTNRFYSFRHQAGVVTNVDVTNPHQIVLRAQAVGQEFAGEGSGRADECGCQAVTPAHPELMAGAERPWMPSVYYYDPNASEASVKC